VRQIDNFARNTAWVNLVFEQIRNLSLISIVFSAAAWKETHLGTGWLAVWDHLVAAILFPAGIFLTWINHQNLLHRVRSDNASKWLKRAFVLFYCALVAELFRYMLSGHLQR
jgi:uncharacterized membrane protein SirB2